MPVAFMLVKDIDLPRAEPPIEGSSEGVAVYHSFIREGRLEDLSDINRITDEEFGAGLFLRRYQERIFETPEILCHVVITDDRVVGYALSAVVDGDRLREEFRMNPLPGVGLHGVAKMAAVERRYQGKGMGSAVIDHMMSALIARGAGAVYGSAWFDPRKGKASSAPMLERWGLVAQEKVDDFWREESLALGSYPCSACGVDCRCSAIVFSALTGDLRLSRARS